MIKAEDKLSQILLEFLATTPDPEFQPIVNELASKNFQSHLLKAVRMSDKESAKLGPAASFGVYVNGPVGYVFLADDVMKIFTPSELRFVIGHEISHIVKSHVIGRYIITFLEEALVELFSKNIVTVFKALFYIKGDKVLDQKVIRENELEADKDAVNLIGDRDAAISALQKLVQHYAGGNLDAPSHFALLEKVPLPVVSFRERIDNLRSSY